MIRRLLLSLPIIGVLSGVAFSAAYATTITVTTNVDEDGENSSACSLREAIKASETKSAYGGCPAGQQYFVDYIQLAADTYQLTRGELVVKSGMQFYGASNLSPYDPDPISGVSPKRLPVSTTIVAAPDSRIFNTSMLPNSDLNLTLINLSGGTGNLGGSILAGGTVELNGVNITGATATGRGGAIFLEGVNATLTATATTFTKNTAPQGSVLGMSCFDNLRFPSRSITLTQLSVTNNGSPTSLSIFDFCGKPTVTIAASTIAQNTTSKARDGIGRAAIIRIVDSPTVARLDTSSSLGLVSNTITENTTAFALLYGKIAAMTLTNNILAFNDAQQDCDYQGEKDINGLPVNSANATYNLFASTRASGSKSTSKCPINDATTTASTETNIYASTSQTLQDFVSPLGYYGDNNPNYYGYLPLAGKALISKGASTVTCGSTDQRGLTRGSGKKITITANGTATANIPCDIGAMDLSVLTANDEEGAGNTSYANVINLSKQTADTTGLTPAQAAQLAQINAAYYAEYKSSFHYREVVIDITKNDFPDESVDLSKNTSTLPQLAPTDLLTAQYKIEGSDNGNIHCEWNAKMKQLLATRKDGTITPGGQRDSCVYTITSKADPSKSVTGTAWFAVTNIAPIAIDHTYTLPFGGSSIALDLLDGASDDGDGPKDAPGYPQGKLPFYQDVRVNGGKTVTIPANIILLTKPTQGHIVAEYEEACITNNVNTTANTCYGGKITYVNDNLFSPFNDSFTYQVIDSDLSPSNTATVKIINTATTTDIKKSGGGSLGLGALLGLVTMALIRRRVIGAKSL